MKKSLLMSILILLSTQLYSYSRVRVLEWGSSSVTISVQLPEAMYVESEVLYGNGPEMYYLGNCETDRGVFVIPISGDALQNNPSGTLQVSILDANKGLLHRFTSVIPLLIDNAVDLSDYDVSIGDRADLVVLNGGALRVDPDAELYSFKNIRIMGGGRLIVPVGAELNADTIFMRAGSYMPDFYYRYAYPQLIVRGRLNNKCKTVYYDYLMSKQPAYTLSLPQDVSLSSLVFDDGFQMHKGRDYKLAYYNGEKRSQEGDHGWQDYDGLDLRRGIGYTMIVNPPTIDAPSFSGHERKYAAVRFRFPNMDFSKGDTLSDITIPVSSYPASADNDAGWNLVGNPYLSDYVSGVQGLGTSDGIGLLVSDGGDTYHWEGTLRYVVLPSNDGRFYTAELVSTASLPAFKNFFVQIGDHDALQFVSSGQRQQSPSRRALSLEKDDECMVGVCLDATNDQSRQGDKLGILIGDYTASYELNADLSKFYNADVNMYAQVGNVDLCYAALSAELADSIGMGVSVSRSGSYTFSLDSRYDVSSVSHVWLKDSYSGATVDLLQGAYECTLSSYDDINRFSLSLSFRGKTLPTSFVEAEADSLNRTYMLEGVVYIKRGDHLYNLLGEQLW